MIEFIDLKQQQARIKNHIDAAISRVLEHGQYILGPEVSELEEKLASFVGSKFCITCANGTDALQIVQMAMGIGPGDEVITPGFTYIATAETVALLGAKPVYVDIDPLTYNLDPKKLEEAITPRTKAIIPVSLYWQLTFVASAGQDLHTYTDPQNRYMLFTHHPFECRAHTGSVKFLDGMVKRPHTWKNQSCCTFELISSLCNAYRNVQPAVNIDKRLDIAQSVINDSDHLNSLLSNPMALITREPIPMRKRLLR